MIKKKWRVSIIPGYDVRYSGEIVGGFVYPVVDTRPFKVFKVFKGGKDGGSRHQLLLARGTKVTGLTFPPESRGKGVFMDSDRQTYEIPDPCDTGHSRHR
jgi:hypothetical protein